MGVRHRLRRPAIRILRPTHYALRRVLLWLLRPLAFLRRAPRPGERLRVRFLLQHAYGTGGTIRTVLNLSGHLAAEHDVEIVSVLRFREKPFFPVPEGVRLTLVDDRVTPPRGRAARLLARLPSLLTPVDDPSFRSMSLRADLLLLRALWRRPPDIVVGTRPSLNLLVAELASRGTVRVGQDHMNLGAYRPGVRREIARSYRRLALLAVLTEHGRAEYAEALAGARTRIEVVPNALPELDGGPSPRTEKVVMAAGRLTRQKGFDLLLKAYGPVAERYPDWTLRIFGGGPHHARLKRRIAELGLEGRVELAGRTARMGVELERSSVYVLSSRFEGLPMVVIEAMSKGLAVVAFDCPTGPAEMIEHGEDGLLVPPRDVAALTDALCAVLGDAGLRDRLGERARRSAERYHMDRIGPRWTRLFAELRPRR